MKPTLVLFVPFLCLFLMGCATVQKPKPPTYQDLATESLGLMDNLAESMSSLSDPSSTVSAAKSMKGIMKQISGLTSQMKAMDAPPADVQAMFQQQMIAKQGAIAKSMMSAMMGAFSNPELAKNLKTMTSQLRQLGSSMQP